MARSTSPVTARERQIAGVIAAIGASWAVALLMGNAVPALKNQAATLRESWGLAPSAAALIYYLARCRSPLSWFTENRAAILLGEASYSIYLPHWVFMWVFASSGLTANVLFAPKIALAWLMTGILGLGCYRYFEWPARVFLRRVMAPSRNVVDSIPQRSSIAASQQLTH